MLGKLLEIVFPSPRVAEPSLEDVAKAFAAWNVPAPQKERTPHEKAAALRAVGAYPPRVIPPAPPPPPVMVELSPREAALTGFAGALDALARRGRERLANATPVPAPDPVEGRLAMRRYALKEVRDRVMLYCLGEIQNQRPELALEYRKAWDSFEALWKIMCSVDPSTVRRRT